MQAKRSNISRAGMLELRKAGKSLPQSLNFTLPLLLEWASSSGVALPPQLEQVLKVRLLRRPKPGCLDFTVVTYSLVS